MEKTKQTRLDKIRDIFSQYCPVEKIEEINNTNIKIYSNIFNRRKLLEFISSDHKEFSYVKNMKHSSIGGLLYEEKYKIFLKPFKMTYFKLTPLEMKLTDINYNISEYYLNVVEYLDKNIANVELQLSLKNIVRHYANDSIIDTSMFNNDYWKNSYPLNIINNQFGEVIGPIACISKGYTSNCSIYFPSIHNFPLIDYEVGSSKISQKSGRTTNTIKISDLIILNSKLTQFNKELEEISKNPVRTGAYNYVNYLKNNGIDYFNDIHKENMNDEELYYLEKRIEKFSREEKDYTNDIISTLENKIRYMNFEIYIKENNLYSTFHEIGMDEFRRRKLYLKSKNSTKRFKDKLGFSLCNI